MLPEEIIAQLVDEAIEIESQTKKNEEGRYILYETNCIYTAPRGPVRIIPYSSSVSTPFKYSPAGFDQYGFYTKLDRGDDDALAVVADKLERQV